MNALLLYQLFECVSVIFETLIIYQYIEKFSERRRNAIFTFLGFALFSGVLMILNVFGRHPVVLITYCGIGIFALAFFLYQSSIMSKLFLALLFTAIIIVSEIISAGIITRIINVDFNIVAEYGVPRVISIVMSKLVLIIIVKLTGVIVKSSRDRLSLLEAKQALPLFLCQIFSILLAHYVFVLSAKIYADFNMIIFLSMIGILYMNFIMFWYFENIMAVFDLRVRSEAAEGKLKLQTQYYTLVEEHQKETIAMRHDMRRHIALIKSLIKDSHDKISAEYVTELEKQLESKTPVIQTPHPLISAMLTDEKRKALELNIDFRANVNLVAEIKVNPADLCVMIGNILDNAIEACAFLPPEADRYVSIEIMQRDFKLLIAVENPYNSDLKKPPSPNHGFGLKNVEKVVDKYGGLMDRNAENGIYKVRIIIP